MSVKSWLASFVVILDLVAMLGVSACQAPDGSFQAASQRDALQATGLHPAAAPRLTLLDEAPTGLRIEVSAGRFEVGLARTHGRLFSTLLCPGCGTTTELGRPALPVVRRLVEVPAGMGLEASLVGATRRTVTLEELGVSEALLPVQRPVEKLPGAEALVPFAQDEELYATDALYPVRDVTVSGPFEQRGHRLFMVEYVPLRINPARGELEATTGGLIALTFTGEADLARALEADLRASPSHEGWLRRSVLNPRLAPVPRGLSTDKYAEGILVVVGNAYAANANLAAYVEERRAEGHRVEVVQMSAIGTTDTQLRSYVRGQYTSWSAPALSYVVLVGDTADVPVHNGSGGGNSQVTDLYYASIDPDNYTADLLAPDLMVSRISVNNANELNLYLARATKYIWADFPTDSAWLRKWSWIASCDNSDISEGTHNYVINTYTAPAGFTGTYPVNPTAGGDKLYCGQTNPNQATIASALGNGRVVVNMSGHGGETYWADPMFEQSALNTVLPADAIPYVISNACLTGSFGMGGGDCWGEMWLAHQKGAILFFGASNSSYWDEDDIFERVLWDGVFQDGITRLADINQNAKLQTLAHYGANDTMQYYFEMYNNLGDGTIDLYTDVPEAITAMYPTEIPIGMDTLDFSVTTGGAPVAGALVAVRGLGVQQVGTTDAAGEVQLLMNPAPADVGDLAVVITGHNLQRHAGVIQVVPADGPYLVHAGHEVTADGTTPVAPTPGRHVVLPISLRNVGVDPATAIQATLSVTGTVATLTQPAPVFPDVAAGAVARSTTHAELDISAAASDGAMIPFSLEWTTAEGASGTSRFGVTVGRPHLVYVSHTVDDSAGMCDTDGIPDVGEPTLFAVTLRNDGSADANGVEAALSAAGVDGGDPVALGAVPSGGEATATFEVLPLPGIECPDVSLAFTLSASAAELPGPDTSQFHETLNGDIVGSTWSDDVEGGTNGWTHGATEGTDDWAVVSTSSHSPTHAWWCSNPGSISDKYLDTPLIAIGDTAVLSFWHRMSSESGYDGGTLEIGVNGRNFVDAGAYITQNGYNDSNWGGDTFWGGDIPWQQVLVDLSSFGPASVKLRFRFTSDSSQNYNGWWIDDLLVDTETLVCQQQACVIPNRAPTAVAGPDQDVAEGAPVQLVGSGSSDPDEDPLTYAWVQVGGQAVLLGDPTAADPGFTAPDVAGQETLTFELTVSDGEYSGTDTVRVTVWDCTDGDPCTAEVFDGAGCAYPPAADGTACDDGDPCTVDDACLAGACTESTPRTCQPSDACHVAGTCDPATGLCSNPPAADGTACDDGDACTLADTCQAGACQAGAPRTCAALDACHVAGVCDPATGVCSDPPAADGTACDDQSLCSGSSSCQAGVCTGADLVVCEAIDECHEAGVCDPTTGLCTSPRKADGEACGDGGTCQAGTCVGGEEPDDGGGCGCATEGPGSPAGLVLLGLALALLRGRRRA